MCSPFSRLCALLGVEDERQADEEGRKEGTMPGKASVTVAVAVKPSSPPSTACPPKSFPFALKKIMDIPPPNILDEGDDGKISPLSKKKKKQFCCLRFVHCAADKLLFNPVLRVHLLKVLSADVNA